jgi:C4-dicarboxylate transporter
MKYFLLAFTLCVSLPSMAGTACSGKVKSVMEREGVCNGNLAYLTNNAWMCTISKTSSSIVLAAYAANKTIETVFSDTVSNVANCDLITTHFLTPWSIRTVD